MVTDYGILAIIPALIIIALIITVVVALKKGSITPSVIVGIAVVVIVLVACIPFINDPSLVKHKLQFDDYILDNDVTDSSGSIEIVTVGDDTYYHAASLGSGTITKNSTTYYYDVVPATLDVWFLTGQSNSAYYKADTSTASPVAPLGTSYYFGTSDGPVEVGTVTEFTYDPETDYQFYSMTNPDGTAHIGNIEQPFAAEYYEKVGNKVYVINGGIGGAWVTSFMPSTGNYYWYEKEIFERGINAIDQSNYRINYVGMLWVQGESNSTMSVNAYKIAFTDWYEATTGRSTEYVFNDLKIDSILISQTRDPNGTSNAVEAQKQLASSLDGVYLATDIADTFTVANGKMASDDLHYSQLGDNEIGVAFADYYFQNIFN